MYNRLTLGVSACLLGAPVYHDGRPRPMPEALRVLQEEFDLLPLCPEMAAGFGAPRPTLALYGGDGQKVADGQGKVKNWYREEITSAMLEGSRLMVELAAMRDVAGLILKDGSPSCGVLTTSIKKRGRTRRLPGVGVFTAMAQTLSVPFFTEQGLQSPLLTQDFVKRVRLLADLKVRAEEELSLPQLERLWHKMKVVVLEGQPSAYQRIQALLNACRAGQVSLPDARAAMFPLLREALTQKVTESNRIQVLTRTWGHLKKYANEEERSVSVYLLDKLREGQRSTANKLYGFYGALYEKYEQENLLSPRI